MEEVVLSETDIDPKGVNAVSQVEKHCAAVVERLLKEAGKFYYLFAMRN